jgi:hypothetical protein
MNLYCCQFDLFENALSYFHEIICYCCTNSFEQIYPSRHGRPESPHGRPESPQGRPESPHGRPESPNGRPESPREATEYFITRFSYPLDYRPLQNE